MSIIKAYNHDYPINICDIYTDGNSYAICIDEDNVIFVSNGDIYTKTIVRKCKFADAFNVDGYCPYKYDRCHYIMKCHMIIHR